MMTIEALYTNMRPAVHLHIADDGSSDAYRAELASFGRKWAPTVTMSNSERRGYGANVNLASQLTHQIADHVFMIEDDWQLCKPLNLAELSKDLDETLDVDCIRLGYLSWTQPMWGKLVCGPYWKYLLLDGNSPEPHVFAGHPRLEKVSYQREVGPWPEGLDPNQTEFTVAHNRRARQGVAWPLGIDGRQDYGLFAHIGSERARD
jgi:glycosyltransferase involved in cell wall biosynthesis